MWKQQAVDASSFHRLRRIQNRVANHAYDTTDTLDSMFTRRLQVAKLTASDGTQDDGFGEFNSVGISNNTIVVGSYRHFGQRGAAYVYQYNKETGKAVETSMLTPDISDGGFWFGDAAAISGNVIVIGEPLDDQFGAGSGAAYVFAVQENGTTTQLAKLVASDAAPNVWLGGSTAIDQNVIVVGAPTSDPTVPHTGKAYVFMDLNGQGIWTEVSKLNFDGNNSEAFFGVTVDVVGERIVVGTNVGSAHVFRNVGDSIQQTWSQVAKLTTNNTGTNSIFGQSVTIAQNLIVVGAPLDRDGHGYISGSAFVFYDEAGNDNWTEVAKLTPAQDFAQSYDLFGDSVAISEDALTIVVGATGMPGSTVNYTGAAYVYKRNPGQTNEWTQSGRLMAADGKVDSRFGSSTAISNNIVVISAPHDDEFGTYSGSAYIFDTEMQETSPTNIPTPSTSTITPSFTEAAVFPSTLSPSSTATFLPSALHSTMFPEISTQAPSGTTQADSTILITDPPTDPIDRNPVVNSTYPGSTKDSSTIIYVSAFVVLGIIIIVWHFSSFIIRNGNSDSISMTLLQLLLPYAIEAEQVYPAPEYPLSSAVDAAVLLVEESSTILPGIQNEGVEQPAILTPTYKNQVESATVALKHSTASHTAAVNINDATLIPRYKDQVNRSSSATPTSNPTDTTGTVSQYPMEGDEDGNDEEFPQPAQSRNDSSTNSNWRSHDSNIPKGRDPPSTYHL